MAAPSCLETAVKGGDILDNRGGGILYHQGLSAQGKCHLGFIRG